MNNEFVFNVNVKDIYNQLLQTVNNDDDYNHLSLKDKKDTVLNAIEEEIYASIEYTNIKGYVLQCLSNKIER